MTRAEKLQELQKLRESVQQLESELAQETSQQEWPPKYYYTAYHILAGFVLGIFGAATSLLFNIIGSLLIGQHPLRLIQVYLTFPLGAQALEIDTGLALAIGCCLYLITGMFLGIPFHYILTRFFADANFSKRFIAVSILSLLIWIFNFYAILSWLQYVLFGGSWIIEQIPIWVAALTHLVFGWTILLVQPLGVFIPYRQTTEAS